MLLLSIMTSLMSLLTCIIHFSTDFFFSTPPPSHSFLLRSCYSSSLSSSTTFTNSSLWSIPMCLHDDFTSSTGQYPCVSTMTSLLQLLLLDDFTLSNCYFHDDFTSSKYSVNTMISLSNFKLVFLFNHFNE